MRKIYFAPFLRGVSFEEKKQASECYLKVGQIFRLKYHKS